MPIGLDWHVADQEEQDSFRVSGTARTRTTPPRQTHYTEDVMEGTQYDAFGGNLIFTENPDPVVVYELQATQDETEQLERRFNRFSRTGTGLFVPFQRCTRVGDLVRFQFIRSENMTSLRDWVENSSRRVRLEDIFGLLLEFLLRYQRATAGQPYTPLRCITMDTVMVDPDLTTMTLLPLQYFAGMPNPNELPGETFTDDATERTDLYAAAYTACKVVYRDDLMRAAPSIDIVRRCLSGLPALRPSLKEAAAELSDTKPAERAEEWEGGSATGLPVVFARALRGIAALFQDDAGEKPAEAERGGQPKRSEGRRVFARREPAADEAGTFRGVNEK